MLFDQEAEAWGVIQIGTCHSFAFLRETLSRDQQIWIRLALSVDIFGRFATIESTYLRNE